MWVKDRIENPIRFGAIAEQHFLDRTCQVVSFEPGSIFACVRWASNGFGIIVFCADILRAVTDRERYSTVPYVRPDGEILLRLSGWAEVEKGVTGH